MVKRNRGVWIICMAALFAVDGVEATKGSGSSKPPTTRRPQRRAPVKRKAARRRAKARKAPKLSYAARLAREIRRVGPGKYTISARAKRYFLIQISYVKLKVVVEVYNKGGRAVGYHLYYVSKTSPLRRMGFLEKDVILSVNQRPIRSEYQAMMAYYALKKKKKYVVRILRKGKRRTLRVEVK